jgi:hypothetical protein
VSELPQVDFTRFRPKEKKPKEYKAKIVASGVRWWLAEDKILPEAVMNQVVSIIQADRGRIESYNTYAKLYGNMDPNILERIPTRQQWKANSSHARPAHLQHCSILY